jgi:CNT family concentrative nucleoside transporter
MLAFLIALTVLGAIVDTIAPTPEAVAFTFVADAVPMTDSAAPAIEASFMERALSLLGVFAFVGLCTLISNNRRRIDWKLVAGGIGLQFLFAFLILKTPFGEPVFNGVGGVFNRLLSFTAEGSKLVFGDWAGHGTLLQTFAFGILPTVIFFSALMSVAYYIGLMQRIVRVVAKAMQKTMKTSGSETLSAAANIFVGQTEAPLLIKPYVGSMTNSELMAVMTGGFATVAGGVMAAYIGMLVDDFPNIAGHLLAASVMSAPAALVCAKIIFPETEDSPTRGDLKLEVPVLDANIIDAAARGAGEGLTLALNVAAMLLAFVALVAMLNFGVAWPSYVQHGFVLGNLVEHVRATSAVLPPDLVSSCVDATVAAEGRAACIEQLQTALGAGAPAAAAWPVFTLQSIFGYLFWPLAFIMGTPVADCQEVAQLIGTKTILNEFIAYADLDAMLEANPTAIEPRSVIISTYALCGFSNLGSIAIQIGGIGAIAPERRQDLAKLGFRAMIAGSFACFMTATIAGVLA